MKNCVQWMKIQEYPLVSSGFWTSWNKVSTSSQRGTGDTVILESEVEIHSCSTKPHTALPSSHEPPWLSSSAYQRSWLFCPSRLLTGCKQAFYPFVPQLSPELAPSPCQNIFHWGDSIREHLFSLQSGEPEMETHNATRLQSWYLLFVNSV